MNQSSSWPHPGQASGQAQVAQPVLTTVSSGRNRWQQVALIGIVIAVVAVIAVVVVQRGRQLPVITESFIGKELPAQVGDWTLNLATVPTITSPLYNGYARGNNRIVMNAVGGGTRSVEQAIAVNPAGETIGRTHCQNKGTFRTCYIKSADGYLEFFSNDSDQATVAELANLMADHFD